MPSKEQEIAALLRGLVDVVAWRQVSSVDTQENLEKAQTALWENCARQKAARKEERERKQMSLLQPKVLKQSLSPNHNFNRTFSSERLFKTKKNGTNICDNKRKGKIKRKKSN